jgi:coniferyl-aldehyde dehydrogenase
VPASKREAFVEACKATIAKMFPTIEKNPDYTSVVNDKHYARLRSYLDDAKSQGAKLVELNAAGEAVDPSSRKLPLTLVLDPTDEMTVMQDEIFGPILPILTYSKLDEAINYINDHARPLALYYFGHRGAEVDRVLNETISGGVAINATVFQFAQEDLPFGGVGPSGMGHYHAREGFETLSKRKAIFRQSRIDGSGLLRPPYGKLADRLLSILIGR